MLQKGLFDKKKNDKNPNIILTISQKEREWMSCLQSYDICPLKMMCEAFKMRRSGCYILAHFERATPNRK